MIRRILKFLNFKINKFVFLDLKFVYRGNISQNKIGEGFVYKKDFFKIFLFSFLNIVVYIIV